MERLYDINPEAIKALATAREVAGVEDGKVIDEALVAYAKVVKAACELKLVEIEGANRRPQKNRHDDRIAGLKRTDRVWCVDDNGGVDPACFVGTIPKPDGSPDIVVVFVNGAEHACYLPDRVYTTPEAAEAFAKVEAATKRN